LADGELLKTMFKPAFSQRLETLLAVVLLDQRKTAEARATAAPSATRWRNTDFAASDRMRSNPPQVARPARASKA
jgi:hypothetical protein